MVRLATFYVRSKLSNDLLSIDLFSCPKEKLCCNLQHLIQKQYLLLKNNCAKLWWIISKTFYTIWERINFKMGPNFLFVATRGLHISTRISFMPKKWRIIKTISFHVDQQKISICLCQFLVFTLEYLKRISITSRFEMKNIDML